MFTGDASTSTRGQIFKSIAQAFSLSGTKMRHRNLRSDSVRYIPVIRPRASVPNPTHTPVVDSFLIVLRADPEWPVERKKNLSYKEKTFYLFFKYRAWIQNGATKHNPSLCYCEIISLLLLLPLVF